MKKIIIIIIFLFVLVIPKSTQALSGCSDYGFMAYEDFSGYCKCMSGYVWGTDIFGDPYCVSGDSECRDQYGLHAKYDSLSGKCECSYGYVFGKDMFGNTECMNPDDICKDDLGYNAKYNSLYDKCECKSGYELSRKSIGGLECKSCFSKYGLHSSYNYLSDSCECDDGYTLKDGECVEKQNNVYFYLKELDTDNKLAIIKSNYDYKYYLVNYDSGCYSTSFRRYLRDNIVVNLGTDFDVDRYDRIVLYDDDEVCDIRSVSKVSSDFTLEEEEEETIIYNYPSVPVQENIPQDSPIITPAENKNDNNKVNEIKTTKPKIENCDDGYSFSLDKTYCVKTPENAHAVDSNTDVWLCNEGYTEKNNTCIKKVENTDKNLNKSDNMNDTEEVVENNYFTENSSSTYINTADKVAFESLINLIINFFKKIKFW